MLGLSCNILVMIPALLPFLSLVTMMMIQFQCHCQFVSAESGSYAPVHVGVILDLATEAGKRSQTSISLAIEDFYRTHPNFLTRLIPSFRNSSQDVLQVTSAAMDLLTNDQVQVIIGPQASAAAQIVAQVCNRAHVPVVSFSATLPSLSPESIPYFIRATLNDSLLATPIASFIHLHGWRNAVIILGNSDYDGSIFAPLVSALQEVDVIISDCVIFPTDASDDHIDLELSKLKRKQTRLYIVHMSSNLASRIFIQAAKAGMMAKDCSWIVTNSVSAVLDTLHQDALDAMQGIIGFRPYVRNARSKSNFISRFKTEFRKNHPQIESSNPTLYELWAYDAIWSIANAAEKIAESKSHAISVPAFGNNNLTCYHKLAISETGFKYLNAIRDAQFIGLTGEFRLVRGQLQVSALEIVNVVAKGGRVVGFWTPELGITGALNTTNGMLSSNLRTILWPGDTVLTPRGFAITTDRSILRIAVPNRTGNYFFVNSTDKSKVSGYCIDVFDAVMRLLPYYVPYEYIPVATETYDEMITMLYQKEFDAVVGDVTILANRSKYVDFTFPYSEPGISMLVAAKNNIKSGPWIFLKPLTSGLWVSTLCFFLLTGFAVWVTEHRINQEFQGNPSQQLGISLYFSFSSLVFSQKEKLESNLSRFLVIVWLFVVLILTSSYTASFSSMLTVQQLQPTATDVYELLRRGDFVGFQSLFIRELLLEQGFNERRLIQYSSPENYVEALNKGSANGGVTAIFDEVPYIKQFLGAYCHDRYTMVGPIYDSNGFGFAFPRGSSLGSDVSRATLFMKEKSIAMINNYWFLNLTTCQQQTAIPVARLPYESFAGLFIVTAVVSVIMVVISISTFIFKERDNLQSIGASCPDITQKLLAWLKYYCQKEFIRSPALNGSNEFLQGGRGGAEEDASFTSIDNTTTSNELVDSSSPSSSSVDTHNLTSLQEGMPNALVPVISHETVIA